MRATKPTILAALAVGVFAFSMGTFEGKSKGSSASYLSLTIMNTADLRGDGQKTDNYGNSIYTDYDLSGGDACVAATLSPNEFTQVQQNYLTSTHPKDVWCNNAQSGTFKSRYWEMLISDQTACDALFGISASEPCTVGPVNNTDYERILPGNAFSSNSSPITFQFTRSGTGYSVQTDSNAGIAPGANSTRTVTYAGTAKLYHSGTAISGSFPFAFSLVLEKF